MPLRLLVFRFSNPLFKSTYPADPSVTSVFKAASYGCSFCGRVIACQAIGFRQVFEYKSESLVIPCFLHTALCCSELPAGLFRAARSTLPILLTSPQGARSARNVCSLIILNDSTYVRACQAVGVRFSVLNSLKLGNCAILLNVAWQAKPLHTWVWQNR